MPSLVHAGRRRFIGFAGAVGLLPWHLASGSTSTSGNSARSWTPDPDLLDDLPRVMAAFAVPGLAIAVVEDSTLVERAIRQLGA